MSITAQVSRTDSALSRAESLGSYSGRFYYWDQSSNNGGGGYGLMIEKRQLFLRSYQFSRKKSLTERLKRSLLRAKKVIWLRLKSARRLTCFIRLRSGLSHRRRRFVRLMINHKSHNSNSYCFW